MSADMTTAEYRAMVAREMDEETFTAQVLAEAKQAGWLTLHIRPARKENGEWRSPVQGDGKGFPDLLMLRGAQLIVAELKSGPPRSVLGKMSPEQVTWGVAWTAYFRSLPDEEHGYYYTWTPYDMDEIREVLQ